MLDQRSEDRPGLNEPTSESLAQRAQSGERRALNELLSRHKHDAYRVALRMAGNPADAEEIVQNSLERVLRHLARFDCSRRFRPWLLKIVSNQARTLLRKRALKALVFADKPSWDVPGDVVGPDMRVEQRVLRQELQRALGELNMNQREVFVLKHIEGLSFAEISEITGESTNSLKVRAHRARRALLEILKNRGVTLRR